MRWTELVPKWPFDSVAPTKAWRDAGNRWVVMEFPVTSVDDTPWKGLKRVGISFYRKPGKPSSQAEIQVSWSTIQQIKEDLFPGRLGIEVYPDPSEVVDGQPMRWLWLLPPGCSLPFSLSGVSSQLRSYGGKVEAP